MLFCCQSARFSHHSNNNFALAGLFFLSLIGCKPAQLTEHPDAALKAFLKGGSRLAPGQSLPLVVVATLKDGQTIQTRGAGGGTLSWDYLSVTGPGIYFREGLVTLLEDPRKIPFAKTSLEISSKENAQLKTRLEIPIHYETSYVADFSGAHGTPGQVGRNGSPGSNGPAGSKDPTNPRPGGHGSDGENGGDGGNATPGQPGRAVRASLTLHPGHTAMLQAKVVCEEQERCFLLDAHQGSLLIKSNGGQGALGGRSGTGGQGGTGGSGIPNGQPGKNGQNGRPGASSQGAHGGSILVFVDPSAKPFLNVLTFSNRGGAPGGVDGPAPEIHEQNVPILW